MFLRQIWTLAKKDLLLVARRSWLTTLLRALVLPILVTFIISYIRVWTATSGVFGVGKTFPLISLSDALVADSTRTKFVIVDHNLVGADVRDVIAQLSFEARRANKKVHILPDAHNLTRICPTSHQHITECFAAVEFLSSPDSSPNAIWNYTLYYDKISTHAYDVSSNKNYVQTHTLPLQHAVEAMITSSHGGPGLPDAIQQHGYTSMTQAGRDQEDRLYFTQYLVSRILAWIYFVGLCGITYHLTGHVAQQREIGILQLIDAMLPAKHLFAVIGARILSVYLAFVMLYLPGWIIMGAITGLLTFSNAGVGWFILLYILAGLALTSYSVFFSSLFKKEQISAFSAILAAFIFAIIAQFAEPIYSDSAWRGAYCFAFFFPPSTFVYSIKLAGTAGETFSKSEIHTPVTMTNLLGALVFQIVFYLILGATFEKFLHCKSSRPRYLRAKESMGGDAVRVINVSKHYRSSNSKRDVLKAIDNVSLNLLAGSITVLLGANGSGKTTLLHTITGLETPDEGEVEITATGAIGLCPQKNIHWGRMSVEEHVRFFEELKRPSCRSGRTLGEIERTIADCDLATKRTAFARTLSGGQMRKLQLAMMLAGGSRICCVDEASSSLDPLARQKIWDVLLKQRGDRTLLLTTHFLDEAEVLADHVAILSKGKLKVEGSVTSLKSRLGGAYQVVVTDLDSQLELGDLPSGITQSQDYNITTFDAPDASTLASLLNAFDRFGVSGYSIRGPTMANVFRGTAEEMDVDHSRMDEVAISRVQPGNINLHCGLRQSSESPILKLDTGTRCGFIKQLVILLRKRRTVLKHNFVPQFFAIVFPIALACASLQFLKRSGWPNGLSCAAAADYPGSLSKLVLSEVTLGNVYGPSSSVSRIQIQQVLPNITDSYYYWPPDPTRWRWTTFVESKEQFDLAIQDGVDRVSLYLNLRLGGLFVGEQPTFAFNAAGSTAGIFMQGTLNMVLSNMTFGVSGRSFQEPYAPADMWWVLRAALGAYPYTEEAQLTFFDPHTRHALIAVFGTLAFAVYPGLFALYPTGERLYNIRDMQRSNGVLGSSLWVAYALFDSVTVLVVCVSTTVIWSAVVPALYGPGYVFVTLLLYSMAATVYSYIISLFAKSQVAAVACTSLFQAGFAMLLLVGYAAARNEAPAGKIDDWFNYFYYTLATICPAVSLFRALMISLNVYALACRGSKEASYPGEFSLYGAPIVYLTLQVLFFVGLLIFLESGRSLDVFGIRRQNAEHIIEEIEPVDDPDAEEDEKHLASSNGGLRVYNLTKTFGPVRAVENVSLGILPSEKVALLGCNGAGKSTTISLIRGEIEPDRTDPPAEVYISGDGLMTTPLVAKNHLGVCPQYDAVDDMTLSEHLHFYAQIQGVPDEDRNVQELIHTLELTKYAHKMAKKLPGGIKRKMFLAIALIANPSVLLLDEPSRGLDPIAKQTLWTVLSNLSAGRSLLLTTHSMEEAAALCDRAAIMATNMLALGTISDLCARYGDKIYIHIVHQDAPSTTLEEMVTLWRWVKSTFVVVDAEQRTYGGQLRFAIPVRHESETRERKFDGRDLGRLFRILETMKAEMGIRDYSIGPTTLGQVFLNVVAEHDVVEENARSKKKGVRVQAREMTRRAEAQWKRASEYIASRGSK